MSEEEIKQLKLERDTAIFVAKERLDEIERIKNQKEIFELRYLKADKEIERLNGALQTHEILLKSNTLEIERLQSIIKEVREYIKEKVWDYDDGVKKWTEEGLVPNDDFRKELLEILDKENI